MTGARALRGWITTTTGSSICSSAITLDGRRILMRRWATRSMAGRAPTARRTTLKARFHGSTSTMATAISPTSPRRAAFRSKIIFDLNAALRGDVGEIAVAIVVVEPWKRAFKVVRRAVGARPAIDLVAHLRINILRPSNVIADEQIELPVVVVIHPRSARAPVIGGSTDASYRSD